MARPGRSSQALLDQVEALEGIQQGLADVKAGRTDPARQVFARLHCKPIVGRALLGVSSSLHP